MAGFRTEFDSMGEVQVPEDAYYGAQTRRAVENFGISNLVFPSIFIRTLGMIKKNAARVNADLGLLDKHLTEVISQAANEVATGKLNDQFVLDVFQTGSGTSTNMNCNEVIAGRANEILTGKRGGKSPVHPNDHVNKGQSSNDVIPSAIHISAATAIREELLPSMACLEASLKSKEAEFAGYKKIGRTHLQDALPITLGDEFGGYARQVRLAAERTENASCYLNELALGGTAVGNGVGAHPEFAGRVISLLNEETGYDFREASNHFAAQSALDAAVHVSGALKSYCVALTKIANDLRFLASGPRCGLGEINLPSLQPGSSIMPGKINPVIPEMVLQVAAHVIGNDAAITLGGQWGVFELNLMMPLVAYNLLQSIEFLSAASFGLARKCVDGITANVEKCRSNLESSLELSTALVPAIGYEKAAEIAKKALRTGKTIRQTALETGVLSETEVNRLLDGIING